MDHMLENSEYALALKKSTQNQGKKRICFIGSSNSADKIRQYLNETDLVPYNDLLEDKGNIELSHMDEFCTYLPEIIESRHFIPLIVADEKSYCKLQSAMTHDHWISGIVDRSFSRYACSGEKDYNRYIGIQKHFGPSKDYGLSQDAVIRLNEVRFESQKAEVALRNVDTAFIHLDALRFGDNIGHRGSWTAGMTIEEMCQIAKYIGASINLKGLIIGGYDENNDTYGNIAKNISTIVWYLCEGYQIRQNELASLKTGGNHNTYTVVPDDLDCELVFHENKQSGRWWLELPYQQENEEEKALMACSSIDYEEACSNHISDKILKIFSSI